MKIKWTEETTTRVASNLCIAAGAIVLFFLLQNFGALWRKLGWLMGLLSPFIFGFVIAYLLNGPTSFFERCLNRWVFRKKPRPRLSRNLAVVLSIIATLLVLTLIIYSIVPQIASSIMTLVNNMDSYITSFTNVINSLIAKFHIDSSFLEKLIGSWQEWALKLSDLLGKFLPQILGFSKSLTSGLANFFLGFIISIYLLAGKEKFIAQFKKTLFALLPNRFVTSAIRLGKFTNRTFSRYISGQLLDSLVLGVICFICMSVLRMEYALLISFFVAVTNIIPFIGPVIGAVPGVFILLMVDPIKALWFLILIIVLQQLDGNFLAPKIVGKSTGLPAFWVVFAIFFGGGMFGIVGVLLAVPTFSVLYVLIKNLLEARLKKKNLPVHTGSYNDSDQAM